MAVIFEQARDSAATNAQTAPLLRGRILASFAIVVFMTLGIAACSTALSNAPINAPGSTELAPIAAPAGNLDDTIIALSFSGGGTRAAAFSYGILEELARTRVTTPVRRTSLIDQVDFISSVSGGSVTAAYFALKGADILTDFRRKFLLADVEASLRTSLSLANVLRAGEGGVNDRTGFQEWLDDKLLHKATFADVFRHGRPILWINASDIYNRTPFVFNRGTFNALCSDLASLPLSEAVAASAAVPLVFAPVVIKNYAPNCSYETPEWIKHAASNPEAPAILRANAQAIIRYRRNEDVKYVKLLDGGLTDNLGLSGLVLAKLAAKNPYEPLTPQEAVRIRRMLFVIVDAGRPPGGDWAKTVEGPKAGELILAVSDTAVDANIRGSYDYFKNLMTAWRSELIQYRCGLSRDDIERLQGSSEGWNCRDLSFHIVRASFDQVKDEQVRAKLETIPTRFKLPRESVDLLISSAGMVLRDDPEYQAFLRTFRSHRLVALR